MPHVIYCAITSDAIVTGGAAGSARGSAAFHSCDVTSLSITPKVRLFTTYLLPLASHAWKRRLRESSGVFLAFALIGKGLLYAILIAISYVAGVLLEALVVAISHPVPADVLIHQHLLHGLITLLAATTLVQGRSRLDLRPYRYLPLSRVGVASVGTALDLLRLPLLVFVGFAIGAGGALSGISGSTSVIWIGVAVCLGTAAALLGRLLRLNLMNRPVQFYAMAGAAALLVGIDAVARLDVVSGASTLLSQASASGRTWTLGLATSLMAAAFVVAARVSAKRLTDDIAEPQVSMGASRSAPSIQALANRHPIAMLELRMLHRCAFPRYQFRGIGLLLLLLLSIVLLTRDDAYTFIAVLFVVVGFSLAYAQLAFAWNSDHFPGLFSLPISMDVHVYARWLVAMVLTVVPAIAMTPLTIVSNLGDPLAPMVCFLFAIGCLNPVLMLMSVLWSKRVFLDSGGIVNLKAYTWHLYLAMVGLWMGSELLVALTSQKKVLLVYLSLGVFGLLLQPTIVRRIAAAIRAVLPVMAERFRAAA